jgi:hypothetical protein
MDSLLPAGYLCHSLAEPRPSHRNGRIRATEEVLHELDKKHDIVHAWVRERQELFVELDDDVQLAVAEIILPSYPKLLDTRADRSGADPFVIALALMQDCTVVTGERSTGSLKRPNIPDVCSDLGIDCCNLLDLIRREGWIF